MSIFSQFSTDAKKEAEGVKITFGPNKDGSIPSVTILRAGKSNKRYAKVLEAVTRPYRRQLELGTLDNDTAEKLFKKVFADSVVLGWEHIQEDDGTEIAFSKEAAVALFEKLPEFYDELQKQANLVSNFRIDLLEQDAGN